MEPLKLKLSMPIKARMLARQEVLRARALKSDILDIALIEGMIKQNDKLRLQMENILKGAVLALFLAFVAWKGGNIKIPGAGATIAEIPAFFELALVVCAVQLSFVPFLFLSTQLYDGVISVLIESHSRDGLVDADLLKASKLPEWLVFKYARVNPTVERENLYENSKLGKIFYAVLIYPFTVIIFSAYLMLNVSMIYLAFSGLSDSLVHWLIFLFCTLCFIVAVIGMLGNTLQFAHTVRNDLHLDDPKYQPTSPQPE